VPPDIGTKTFFTKTVNTEVQKSSGSSSSEAKAPRLEKPVRITEQSWPEGTVPVVSVFCITYNHAQFVREAIEGFLMQETTFPVEIFIHDDASTDGTTEIIKEYAQKYPQLFRMVLQSENQYARKRFAFLFEYLSRQRGEFIAFCEGDDYWTNPRKLELQVGILEGNPRFALSHHLVSYVQQKGGKPDELIKVFPPPEQRWPVATGKDLVWSNFIQTCSIVFRRSAFDSAQVRRVLDGLALGDWPLCVMLCQRGDISFMDQNMAVYRIHGSNYWAHLSDEVKSSKVEVMSLRLAQNLEYRHALPWFQKIASTEISEFYRASLAGAVISYLAACRKLTWRAWRVRFSLLAYVLPLSAVYLVVCLREFAKRSVFGRQSPPETTRQGEPRR
jgi:glycosyltransferase involved in cell wall biosynthesis